MNDCECKGCNPFAFLAAWFSTLLGVGDRGQTTPDLPVPLPPSRRTETPETFDPYTTQSHTRHHSHRGGM